MRGKLQCVTHDDQLTLLACLVLGESGDGGTPTKSADVPKKKSILKKDAINKEETETLLRDGQHAQDDVTSDTAASPPLQRQSLFRPSSSSKPSAAAAAAAAASCPPKINPPPKTSRPTVRLQPHGAHFVKLPGVSDNGSSSPPSRESAAAAAAACPSLLKADGQGCQANNHDVSTASETADARRSTASKDTTPDEAIDNFINSFAGPGIDDSKIAFIDEQSPVENVK